MALRSLSKYGHQCEPPPPLPELQCEPPPPLPELCMSFLVCFVIGEEPLGVE